MKNLITLERFNEITNKFATLTPIVVVGDVGIDKYTFGEVKRISVCAKCLRDGKVKRA